MTGTAESQIHRKVQVGQDCDHLVQPFMVKAGPVQDCLTLCCQTLKVPLEVSVRLSLRCCIVEQAGVWLFSDTLQSCKKSPGDPTRYFYQCVKPNWQGICFTSTLFEIMKI